MIARAAPLLRSRRGNDGGRAPLYFLVVIAWERFFDAEKALAAESGAAATLYRLSTFFFGTQSVMTQAQMTGILAALIFSAILVIIAIDRPFTGSVVVSKEPIETVLEDFQSAP